MNAASEHSQATKFDVVFGESLDLENSATYMKQFLWYGFDEVELDASRAGTEANKLFESTLDPLNKKPGTAVNAVVNEIAGEEAAGHPVFRVPLHPRLKLLLQRGHAHVSTAPTSNAFSTNMLVLACVTVGFTQAPPCMYTSLWVDEHAPREKVVGWMSFIRVRYARLLAGAVSNWLVPTTPGDVVPNPMFASTNGILLEEQSKTCLDSLVIILLGERGFSLLATADDTHSSSNVVHSGLTTPT
ncbi:hypothetical protein PHYPSEUDO_013685 [Phytophthora pseudosyringae]|uniref:Uncharacterized protein n=1 Tax=Phytophthora pseudosyringae TaxID=221518 RepID=A0A8T1W3I0_9STRA|nr:hypothetical protein PHYPSEUDO_013685 [Phytophthora pseudosyringae]